MSADAHACGHAWIVGVGAMQGLGAALARRCAREGLQVWVSGRTPARLDELADVIAQAGGRCMPLPLDATAEADVAAAAQRIAAQLQPGMPLQLVVYNAGSNQRLALLDTTAAQFDEHLRTGCLGGFLVGREAARLLLPQQRGTLIFTGASASLRGRPGFAHFAAAKAGLRMVAQAMAREFGPQGLHVAHVVIDGGLRGERLLSVLPELAAQRGADGLLEIDDVTEAYWQLHRQPRSAWTFELDLRPYKEPF
jgi:NAD(P)-dependent dehydrogenase (short-subunit alcohol dehydrogenase family)